MPKKVTLRCGDHVTITSRKNAERYERHGRARRISDSYFEILTSDPRHIAVVNSRTKKLCFDDGLASLRAVEGLPCVGNPLLLFTGSRPKSEPREDRVRVMSVRRADEQVGPSVVPAWPLPIPRQSAAV